MTESVIVIGAGAAGLATAGLLARKGYRVRVVEKNNHIGGRAGSYEEAGFRWDTGPSWYLMPDAFEHFYQAMGTSAQEQLDLVKLTDPAYRIFGEGEEPLDVPGNTEEVVALFDALEPGAGTQLRRYLKEAGDSYEIAVKRFLYTTFNSPKPFLSWDVLKRAGRLAALLGTSLEGFVDKRFNDRRLRQILSYPAVFLSSRPDKTPALYHLMSHTDLVQGVFYPRGGFDAVMRTLHSLAEAEGACFHTGAAVDEILVSEGRAVGVRVGDKELRADAVVSCADLHHTETQLLAPESRTFDADWFARRDPGVGTVLAFLGVRGRVPELAHHNLFFSREWSHDFDAVFGRTGASDSIYVSMPSATDDTVAPKGDENLFVLVPAPADPSFNDIEAVADNAIELIAKRAGMPDLADRITARKVIGPSDFARDYNAWSGGSIGPAHTLRQSAFLRGRQQSAKVKGLYYAGATTLPGVGVPLCLISAENATNLVCAQ